MTDKIRRQWRLVFAVCAVGLTTSGCLMNAVNPMDLEDVAKSGRKAVIVYGVGRETAQNIGNERDVVRFNMGRYQPGDPVMGNCFRFDTTEAAAMLKPGQTTYFAFDVPEGWYSSSWETPGVKTLKASEGFNIRRGQRIYAGDFILVDADMEQLRREYPGLWRDMSYSEPEPEVMLDRRDGRSAAEAAVGVRLTPATFEPAGPFGMFLCTP